MIFDVIKSTIMITGFVLVIMLIIEYINVISKGNWIKPIENHKWLQYIVSGLLGVIPGCVGVFAIVSMYIHNLIGFGALITALITSFGDEAFMLFALAPYSAFKLSIILLIIGVVAGITVNFFTKGRTFAPPIRSHFQIHNHDTGKEAPSARIILSQLKNISFPRAILLAGIGLIIFGIITGTFNDSSSDSKPNWNLEQILFLSINIIGFVIVGIVSEHFLEEHFWIHVIKKHFLKIFLWTFGTLLFIFFAEHFLSWNNWIKSNELLVLFLALIIGIIPLSGPHIIFITLFVEGTIPFSILLANSIIQDGHGSLPLLAESKKSFIIAKSINFFIALIVGLFGYFYRW